MAVINPVRVLVVDDSALVRRLLTELLDEDPGIEVVGSAADAFIARDKIKLLSPDVLTLDVQMPRMDGLTFLQNLMRLRPMPVVMVSTLTEQGASVTLDALALGAVDFVSKPKIDLAHGFADYALVLRDKVKQAARAQVSRLVIDQTPTAVAAPVTYRPSDRLLAIGASTGGTEAIRRVLESMPANAPAIVITQHIPVAFSTAFAKRLDRTCKMTVAEATDRQQLMAGHVYIAPGDRHLRVERNGTHWISRLGEDDPVSGHRPSVDALFESVARHAGANASAALLTGMGADGARGLLAMREAGGMTLAQDQASSVVWGMPGAAVAIGAAREVLAIDGIAQGLLRLPVD